MADVKKILNDYSIEFVESGSNVAKGNVNVKCPWCGEADKSQHLGINLKSGMWGCWRSAQHRGRALSKLLSRLTGLTLSEARRVCGEGVDRAIQLGEFDNAIQTISEGENVATDVRLARKCGFDEYMHKLTGRKRSQKRAVQYLHRSRGFPLKDIRALARRYDLHFAIKGDYAERIVVPVYEGGVLQTYLGRSIYEEAGLRYRALESEHSVKQVKDCIYNFDNALKGGRTLYFVEGAFDVFKVDFYNYKRGVRAIGLFNMNIEESQAELIYDLKDEFEEFVFLLDRGQIAESLKLEDQLRFLGNVRSQFLQEADDPGELTPEESRNL